MSPHQHPAPARVGWGGGVGLDSSVNWVTVAGVGHGSHRALCGAACSFWPCACGSPFRRHPQQGEKAAWPPTSAREHPRLSHPQEPGSTGQESSAQGTLWGVPARGVLSAWATLGVTAASPWP